MAICQHCDEPAYVKGLCTAHYQRLRKYGNALEPSHARVRGECEHCARPARSHGLCNAHYKKLRKYGDPLAGPTLMRGVPPLARYIAWVNQRGPDDCWPWGGSVSKKGYGQFGPVGNVKNMPAHRYGYGVLVRELKPGETVDHTCHNRDPDCPGGNTCSHRACQNPAHWEAVPRLVNQSRGWHTRSDEVQRNRAIAIALRRSAPG